MGTVPMGTVVSLRILLRMASMSPPVLRSMMVSAPASSATLAFSISMSTSQMSLEVPMFALTLIFNPSPIPSGQASLPRLFVITILPWATPRMTYSGVRLSASATSLISSVMTPLRANSYCVVNHLNSQTCIRKRGKTTVRHPQILITSATLEANSSIRRLSSLDSPVPRSSFSLSPTYPFATTVSAFNRVSQSLSRLPRCR